MKSLDEVITSHIQSKNEVRHQRNSLGQSEKISTLLRSGRKNLSKSEFGVSSDRQFFGPGRDWIHSGFLKGVNCVTTSLSQDYR